jgi:hypothetical protein
VGGLLGGGTAAVQHTSTLQDSIPITARVLFKRSACAACYLLAATGVAGTSCCGCHADHRPAAILQRNLADLAAVFKARGLPLVDMLRVRPDLALQSPATLAAKVSY